MIKKNAIAVMVIMLFMIVTGCNFNSSSTSGSKQLTGVWEVVALHEKQEATSIMAKIQSANFQRAYPIGGKVEFMSGNLVQMGGRSMTYDIPSAGKLRFLTGNGGTDGIVDFELKDGTMFWHFGEASVEFRRV
ncbi:MAG: hypothetical protein P0Y55_14135 [Candidatus Cohnella colombiensis]|uniref:Uncharacterized protein n=1 Tax=Candidatus Cohnella colombiensis TaxID=3121368 RepID=A0AA95JCB1_9BACL|nr:MAG: hypothetical protein P0Y55_14135 [Cohnella sp.]